MISVVGHRHVLHQTGLVAPVRAGFSVDKLLG
jgi:hypothetical protein